MQQNSKKSQLIFGIRAVIEAIQSGKEIDKVYIQEGLRGPLMTELRKTIKKSKTPYVHVPVFKLNKFNNKNHQGVVAFISPIETFELENLIPTFFENKTEHPRILILDRISDVRNFGAICRSAECFGIDAIVIPKKGAAQINEDAIKTSAGALNIIPVCKSNSLNKTVEFLKNSGFTIIACTEKGNKPLKDCKKDRPIALIMGSEEDGISEFLLNLSDEKCYLPMKGKIASLNVSVACGIALYELMN